MVDVPGIYGGGIRILQLLVPVIGYFVVINDMQPWQFFRGSRPVWRGVYLTIFSSVGFRISAKAMRDIDVDEVSKKEHE